MIGSLGDGNDMQLMIPSLKFLAEYHTLAGRSIYSKLGTNKDIIKWSLTMLFADIYSVFFPPTISYLMTWLQQRGSQVYCVKAKTKWKQRKAKLKSS